MNNWAPTAKQVLHGQGELEVELWTSSPCHLTLRWTATQPVKTLHPKEKRGALWYYDNKMCFVAWKDIEQIEPGDTTLHTFLWPGWTLGLTRWFFFLGTIGGVSSPSNTAIFSATWRGALDMITLGKFGEAEVLLGNVKLKEGANITITRIDADNALLIAASVTPPAYTGPNLGPKWDFILGAIASESFGHLAQLPNSPWVYYLPAVGDRALFNISSNIDTATFLTSLLGFTNQTLAVRSANTGNSMPSPIVNSRYIFYPQGFSAGGVRGANLYRYDLWTNAWATMAAITSLGAAFRFSAAMGFVWDAGNYLYAIGGYDGTADRGIFRYSISGNSWTDLGDHPLGATAPYGGVQLIGDAIYCDHCGGSKTFYRYNIGAGTWTARADHRNVYSGAGLVLNEDDPNQLIDIGGSAGTARVEAYSIAGNAWTSLATTNAPTDMAGKGHYFSNPVPHVLVHRYGTNYLYLYKL